MELRDAVLAQRLANSRPDLKRLLDRHHVLDREITELSNRRWLSDDENVRLKQLKREKLLGRDRIEAILAPHRNEGQSLQQQH